MAWTEVGKQVAELYKQLVTLGARADGLEKNIDRVREDQRDFINTSRAEVRELQAEVREMHRRIATLEGLMQSTYTNAMREALLQLGREYLQQHGSLDGFAPTQLAGRTDSEVK